MYHLSPMPGCPIVGILHGTILFPEFRHKGIGTIAHAARLDAAKKKGYHTLLCTTKVDNTAETRILDKFKWKRVREFYNPCTGNTVILWMKHLTDPYEEFGGV